WLDPPFAGGHWVPEMIEIAGGIDVFAKPGDHSARLTWEQVREADPDILVVMPCGYDEAGAAAQLALLGDRSGLRGRMFPVDADGCFSRPGPRLVDGIERLAQIFSQT
ncbi:MAG TPA: cobalamin-binding protein, partial [Thermoanaerobaculia bacterium]|nr:cobalamin-binding protein [Thermoanaerobaculia bacterium]